MSLLWLLELFNSFCWLLNWSLVSRLLLSFFSLSASSSSFLLCLTCMLFFLLLLLHSGIFSQLSHDQVTGSPLLTQSLLSFHHLSTFHNLYPSFLCLMHRWFPLFFFSFFFCCYYIIHLIQIFSLHLSSTSYIYSHLLLCLTWMDVLHCCCAFLYDSDDFSSSFSSAKQMKCNLPTQHKK